MCSRYLIIRSKLLVFLVVPMLAEAQQLDNKNFQTNISVQVLPYAILEFLGDPLLYLEIPPAGSTIPANGVHFRVSGNAVAGVSAEPDEFIWVPGASSYLGRAELGAEEIGYNIELRFPRVGVSGSPIKIGTLPGFEASGTENLTVDLSQTNGEREGTVHLEASQEWTPSGAFPLPGIYEGDIILTLTADDA